MADIIETRSRSRSKTPGLLFSENGDSDKKGSKKIPTISLIEEEEDIVEVVPSSQGARAKRPRRNAKVTSDTSGDVSFESPKNSQTLGKSSVITTTTTTVKETVKKTTNGSEQSSSDQTTTTNTVTKSSLDGHVDAPESQSIFNNIFNAIKTSTPILSSKRSKRIIQDTSNVNVAEHPAYKEYRDAGEYWNKYPKTDYTYSELSPHRRELSNGIVAMPNMSRRSLEKYNTRVEAMIQNNPADETFLRRKFLSNTSNSSFQKRSADLQYDSADEVDVTEFRLQLQALRKKKSSIVSRFFLAIVSIFYSVYHSAKQGVRRVVYKQDSYAYTPIRKSSQPGIVLQSFEAVKKFVLLGFSKVYLFISTILCLDTWILYTRSENQGENRKRKRFLLILLALLPLLLFGGTYIYLDPPQNLSFPKLTLPKLSFPEISFPSLPKISFPSISLPSFPQLSWPSWLTFSLPSFSLSWPVWLTFSLPSLSWPAWLTFSLPSLSWPTFSLPSLSWPAWLTFSIPSLSWPAWLTFSIPSLSWPAWLTFSLPSLSWPAWLTFSLPTFSWPAWLTFSLPSISFSWPSWLTFSLPSLSWPNWLTFSMPSFSLSWPAWLTFTIPSFSLSWPSWLTFSLPSISLPSFDISPVINYISDKFSSAASATSDFFLKINDIALGFVNEAQVVWNENFNAVVERSKHEIPVPVPPMEIPVSSEVPLVDPV